MTRDQGGSVMSTVPSAVSARLKGFKHRRVLVVVDEPCSSQSLCSTIRRHAATGRVEALVVAPARNTPATQWYADEDAARADAMRRLRRCVSCLAADGIRVAGRLADPDPLQAVTDALHDFDADRILLVTAPQRPSTWPRPNAIDRIRGSFGLPVDHVVVEPGELLR